VKKLINDPDDFVDEVLDGILATHPAVVAVGDDPRVLVRSDIADDRVGIVTGGGSGHLPLFLGYVGPGACGGAAVGNVFSSPSPEQIFAASQALSAGAGILYLFGNYGGDVLNFEIASEMAADAGIDTDTVIVHDDVLSRPRDAADERRGVAGMVFVYKCAGAAAERGWSLSETARVARKATESVLTAGVGLSPTILPTTGRPSFTIGENEMEIGIGIHGEPGRERRPLESADEIADELLAPIQSELALDSSSRVALLVNGLGATPLEELYILARAALARLGEIGVTVRYQLVGEYATSLEMAGASISVLRLDDELEELLADPAHPVLATFPPVRG
jgi:dihydroxyacetone kinase/dihydroxyacetone kinase-like protein